ncbi:YbhB/YbcL family Raf kinase inhibitor-like protein [Geomonas anaerohicana]|uniref:YbhB/YbcL family Raf kinase inhibitor-like protein n=1 Tax=Geomonas anaerohicana TaxID=2798583 RepID=A0ABS0YIN2_9BACT|nr:YbhB/YbcL family Raf kinase inhibitor-like protein [Geomonas anaerohicana]MBJ6752092.1 YbhB/YbcL family Raf kinase inhibitor-like protein [Geomonas anaerohicana]
MIGFRQRLLCAIVLALSCAVTLQAKEARETKVSQLKLTSTAFSNSGSIPATFTCDGSNASPPLAIAGVPKEARSLALIMDDPDAPGGTWAHWVLWNIDPATTQIAQGAIPRRAQQGENSWRRKSYGGPCPPSGQHRYYFRLYALSERLNLPANSTRKELDLAMRGKILAQAELLGVYAHR